LSKLGDNGKVERTGSGKKGDPFVYHIPYFRSQHTTGTAGTESESTANPPSHNGLFRSQDSQENTSHNKDAGTEFWDPWGMGK
jgi:hypothetical protein